MYNQFIFSYTWGQANVTMQQLPPVTHWGLNQQFEIVWATLPEASKALQILKHCDCKKECKGRCLCRKPELPCTELCKCNGNCTES